MRTRATRRRGAGGVRPADGAFQAVPRARAGNVVPRRVPRRPADPRKPRKGPRPGRKRGWARSSWKCPPDGGGGTVRGALPGGGGLPGPPRGARGRGAGARRRSTCRSGRSWCSSVRVQRAGDRHAAAGIGAVAGVDFGVQVNVPFDRTWSCAGDGGSRAGLAGGAGRGRRRFIRPQAGPARVARKG